MHIYQMLNDGKAKRSIILCLVESEQAVCLLLLQYSSGSPRSSFHGQLMVDYINSIASRPQANTSLSVKINHNVHQTFLKQESEQC
jgi:hypothetical protein